MKILRALALLLAPLAALAQQPTNVQKLTDGTNTLTAPITAPAGSIWNGNTISNTGEGGAGNVSGILQADGSGNVSAYGGILPTNSQACYVSKSGNDTTGNGSEAFPYLTIGKALTSITDASGSKYYQVVVGAGQYNENVVIKPATFIIGQNGGGGNEAGPVRINGTITLDSSFATIGARYGLANIVVLGAATFNFPGVGGAVADTMDMFNVSFISTFSFTSRGSDGGFWQNGYVVGTSSFIGGSITIIGVHFIGAFTAGDAGTTPISFNGSGCVFLSSETFTGSAQVQAFLYGCSPQSTATFSGAGVFVFADATSIPVASSLSISGGATLQRVSDAVGLNYVPSTSSNWGGITPWVLNAALDRIGASKVTASIPAWNIIGNGTGSSAQPASGSVSSFLDGAFGSAQGDVLYRGASGWSALAPGTSGNFFQTQGASANPQWSSALTSFSAGNLSPIFTSSVATSTSTPALTFSLTNQSANLFLGGPSSGAAAAPTFRALTSSDLPAGTGTVTSFSSGNLSPLFTTSVATSTTTPSQTFTLTNQSANLIYAGPSSGAAAAPSFRSLALADLPTLTNGQVYIGSTGNAPVASTITGTQDNLTVTNGAGSITLSTPNLTNAATGAQSPTAATRTYITGTDLHFTAGFLKVGTILRWHFNITKTAAGIATSTFDIAFGTTGTTTDTARCSFTKPAGTAAADDGAFDVTAVVKTASSSGVVVGDFRMIHNLAATGHAAIPCVVVSNTSGTFNTTTVTDVGVCITSGASDALTINNVDAEVLNPN